jgi:hypothetical protein
MVRALRSGAAIIADTGLSYRERREQVRLQKKRKKYEMEQAENAKVGVSGDTVRIATTRATTLEVQEMYTSIVGDNPPIASPSPAKKKRTRSGTVSCTDFGPLRHAHYNKPIPQFFFVVNVIFGSWTRILFQRFSNVRGNTNVLPVTQIAYFPRHGCLRRALVSRSQLRAAGLSFMKKHPQIWST